MRISILKKNANALQSGWSYFISRITGQPLIGGMPVSVGIEISGYCNLSCPECSFGSGAISREGGFMDLGLYKKILNELRPYLYNVNLYFQGEPMLHPRFFDFIEISAGTKITVSTNGHFITEENAGRLALSGLGKIIVSLDGMDNETYSIYRKGGEFEKVISGIKLVSQAIRNSGSSLKLEIQCLVNRHNESQISSLKRFSKDVNGVLRLKSMQVIHRESIDYWQPSDEKFRRYSSNETTKSSFENHCLRLWTNPVITWKGEVVPCCFDKNADHIMGDLTTDSFRSIWNGDKYEIFRNLIFTNRKSVGICRNCTSGLHGVIY